MANEQLAKHQFQAVEIGAVEVTMSDAVVAEATFILTSARHYLAPRMDAAKTTRALLSLNGMHMGSKAGCLIALEVSEREPKLGFPESPAVAHSTLRGHAVARFGRQLLAAAGVKIHDFCASTQS